MSVPSAAIVMPAYNAVAFLERSLPAALAAARGGTVLVVDPGSTDDTAAMAERLGAKVIRHGRRAGPAEARNVGVRALDVDVLLFIDADCVAHPDVLDRVVEAFGADPALVTLTGSYDDSPPDPGFFSQYMNLRHHHTHQVAKTEDATFWAGCGAVRRAPFLEVGGFDHEKFPRPMIEDIELGLRMKKHGKTRLDPKLQVTHLKRWTLRSVVHTDIFCRAVPWTKLIRASGKLPNDLNLRWTQRLAAVVAPFALAAPLVAALLLVLGPREPWMVVAVLLPLVVAYGLIRDLYGFFRRHRGLSFGVRAFLFHQVHLIYSAATFVLTGLFAKRTSGSSS